MRQESAQGPDGTKLLRVLVGCVLVVLGTALGIYLAMTAFTIIKAEKPPGLVNQLSPVAEVAQEKVKEVLDGPAVGGQNLKKEMFDVSPELKKLSGYCLVFGFLLVPAVVVSALIRSGAILLQDGTAEALKQITASLKRR